MTDPDPEPTPSPMLYTVIYTDRLNTYATAIQAKVWSGDRRQLISAMADAAEAHEIARRLYDFLSTVINQR